MQKDEGSWSAIQKLNIAHGNLMAYVTSMTDVSLISAIHERGIAMIADASESARNNASLYDHHFYCTMIDKMKLNILITDFPVEVSMLLK